jgi:glutamine synthetase
MNTSELIRFSTYLPESLKAALDNFCESSGVKIQWLTAKAIEEYLEKKGIDLSTCEAESDQKQAA